MKRITYVTVNRGVIDSNRKHGTAKPAIRVSRGKYGKVVYGHRVIIRGASAMVYAPRDPLPHGARLWLETEAEVLIERKPGQIWLTRFR